MSEKTHAIEEQQNTRGSRAELRDLLKEFDIAMLVTRDEQGVPRGRPMAVVAIDRDATVWFATADHAPKVQEIERDATVAAIFFRDRDKAWISLSGSAQLVRDRAKIREVWSPTMRAWFSDVDDPSILLIRVEPRHGEYYEPKKTVVGRVFEMVKGAVTGTPPATGPVKHVRQIDFDRLSEPGRLSH